MQKNQYSLGITIILIGIIIILGKLGIFSFAWKIIWPLLVLAPGILLHFLYFSRWAPASALVVGGMLITYAVIFILCQLFGWHLMTYLWPGFIFGIAVGLYEYTFFETSPPRSFYSAALVLAVISIIFFGMMLFFTKAIYILAFILIIVGAFLLFRRPNAW